MQNPQKYGFYHNSYLLHEVQNTCRQKVDLGSTSEKVVGAFTRKRDPFYGSLEIEGGKKVC